ncbi:MAG: hydrogenase subunit EhaQ [Candidatus Methanofastidiosum methylothiophilum]|uniref:Hydrogenase subunit EhaQ n=1 Tax=Candidatus Methanofastidiosum methylothiophilum TaxID=1705564 RepID=A0A150IWS6_9EURY|nr:MAG: hydrogenase subunit EhaQ [Candidatus Methanofastidiosum methylthiophilus]KYC47049.1 MAG: hydrogenase subunit EhaQ [Candidatus Methanofastidiosum methylthiophilus]KYC49446.1 MAG: hydrogenase subunit EhaQ [Candidatus Methanofastidiosum methylthiophilus]
MTLLKNVYFIPISSYSETEKISDGAKKLLERVIKDEGITLEKNIPLKVHFGEKGNLTFIKSDNYQGIIDYLKENGKEPFFIETNVLYRGDRTNRKNHVRLALKHGFTQIPIIIADGEIGEEYEEIEIGMKNLDKCKIAKQISNQKQMIVLSHFKGHIGAGFGGAIKQLGMGCAARGGKLEQHANTVPIINPLQCKKCKKCIESCPSEAINIGLFSRIKKQKCIGCAACISVCPHRSIKINWIGSISRKFYERMAEYAYAAQKNKEIIYISFALNITKNCDCEGHRMKPFVRDLGIFASTDPVAIDMACLDKLSKREDRAVFIRGRYILNYSQSIGLGNKEYNLIEIK